MLPQAREAYGLGKCGCHPGGCQASDVFPASESQLYAHGPDYYQSACVTVTHLECSLESRPYVSSVPHSVDDPLWLLPGWVSRCPLCLHGMSDVVWASR